MEENWVLQVKQVLESLCGSENSKGNRVEELNLEKVEIEGE